MCRIRFGQKFRRLDRGDSDCHSVRDELAISRREVSKGLIGIVTLGNLDRQAASCRLCWFAASVWAVAAALPAYGQIEPLRIPDPGAGLTLSADAGYDSNIFRTSDATEPAVDDLIVTPRAILEYKRAVGHNDVRLKLDAAYSYYTFHSDRSRLRADGNLGGTVRIAGACQVEPSARILRQRADYGDVNRAIDNQQTFTTLAVDANCQRVVGFYPLAGFSRDTTANDREFEFADQKSETYTGGVGYNRPSLGKLTSYYTYSHVSRDTLGLETLIDRAGVTFERAIVSRFAVKVDIHYLNARSRGAEVQPYRGLGWDGTFTIRPIPRVRFELGGSRRIINDTLVPAGFAVQTVYSLLGEWQVLPRLRVTASGERGERSFRRDPNVIFSPIGSDTYTNLLAGVRRNISAKMDFTADVRHIKRRTDSGVNAFDLTLANIGISLKL